MCEAFKRWETTHEAHIACGDRCAAIKKNTRMSRRARICLFHGFFLINSIDLCVLSIPLIMWWFNGFWASSFLAQDFNAPMTLASESVSITMQWNNRVKKTSVKKTNPCHQRNPCVFLTLTPIAVGDVCSVCSVLTFPTLWKSANCALGLLLASHELFGWCCRAGRSTSYRQSLTPNS